MLVGSTFPNVPPVAAYNRLQAHEKGTTAPPTHPPTPGKAVVVISADQVNVLVNGTSPKIPPKPARPASRSSSRVEPVARGTSPNLPPEDQWIVWPGHP